MSTETDINELTDIITKFLSLNGNKDSHVSNIFDDIEETTEIEFIDSYDDDIEDEGKYQYISCDIEIEYKGKRYIVSTYQTRSGSYFTDYYYSDASFSDIQTKEEYNAPKVVASFTFKEKTISILENGSAKISDSVFPSTEEAILHILKGE